MISKTSAAMAVLYNRYMLSVSIGIPVYNEEANIGRVLEKLLEQKLKKVVIREIIVIASGCTDRTEEIVKNCQKKDRRIKLLRQKTREGKTVADNLFIRESKSEILVLQVADVLPADDCLEKLIAPFADTAIGITAPKIIPLNDKDTFSGYFSHLWWRLFDKVARQYFRAGEILAFRKIVKEIPPQISSDEVFLTEAVLAKGYQAKYIPEAVAYNMGPKNIKEIILMRRRHNCQTFQVIDFGLRAYFPKTMDNAEVFRFFVKEVNWFSPKEIVFALGSLFLEALCRILGFYDFYFGRKYYLIWPRINSTKDLN